MNVLIIKLGAAGDVVRTTTLLRRLRGRITWLTEEKNTVLLEGVKEGERVIASGNMLIDSQAQLQNVSAPSNESPPLHDPALEMTETQHATMEKYISAVAEVTAALARDDLNGFNDAKAKLPPPPEGLPQLSAVPAADLGSARRDFLPFSEAVANYSMPVRAHLPKLRVFRCPMTNALGKDLPENAKWIQLSDKLQNPFFGREMLECGTEVK